MKIDFHSLTTNTNIACHLTVDNDLAKIVEVVRNFIMICMKIE